MLRRNFIRFLAASAMFSWAGIRPRKAAAAGVSFAHGVASGDPLSDRVILWTRVSGLAGQTLWFQFDVDGVSSPIGRTRTLANGSLEAAKFAVVSCANHPYGYFHAYREIANRDDLDAVIHLGDYIYEYGMGEYATQKAEELGRIPEPPTEAITLDDFRRRHAQYKSDADSLAMHARHPLIAIWDDHEVGNDSWRAGALNHQEDEGRRANRRDGAVQAYLEWMPIRAAHNREHTKIFRSFRYGDLLSLIMLDTRFYGRDLQPDVGDEVTAESVMAAMEDPERRVLGRRQESWLRKTLAESTDATWQLIGQQILVSPLRSADLEPLLDLELESMLSLEELEAYIELSKSQPPMLLDTWDGYPALSYLETARRGWLCLAVRAGQISEGMYEA